MINKNRMQTSALALALILTGAAGVTAETLNWSATDPGNNTWSVAENWDPAQAPQAADEILVGTPGVRTMVMDRDFTVTGFTFLPGSNVDDMVLDLGNNTLTINGAPGFFQSSASENARGRLTISGSGGALVVNHPEATFVHNNVTRGTSEGRLLMEGLGRLDLTLSRFGIGDSSLNDRGAQEAHRTMTRLARTNIIRASFVDDYTQDAYQTAVQFFRNAPFNNGQGFEANLGLVNEIYADSVGVSMGRTGSDRNILRFYPGFMPADETSPKPSAKFRNVDGTGRMSLLAAGVDANTEEGVGSSNRARIDLSGGTVDMLVDEILLAVNRPQMNANANASIRGRLTFDDGIIDANSIRAGYQKHAGDAICQGYIEVNGSGQLIVNEFIELGFATGDNPEGTGGYAAQSFGQINMNGGFIKAPTIRIGNEITVDNAITMNNGAHIEVMGNLASEELKLTTMTMNDSSLTLHVDASRTEPYVYVKNLLTGGDSNTIAIASISNTGEFPIQLPLISYESATPNFVVTLPDGLSGFIINNEIDGTVDVSITGAGGANILTWTGAQNGTWDTSVENWNDTDGVSASFTDGDFVVFTDENGGRSNIEVVGALIPGQAADRAGVTFNTSSVNYTLAGGQLSGTGRIEKNGTGTLTIDLPGEGALTVNEGRVNLTSSATLSQATVGTEGTLENEGSLSGLTTAGTSRNRGEILGPVNLTSGTFTNSGRVDTEPGTITVSGSSTLINDADGEMDVAGGSWEIPPGATLINNGQINNLVGRLNIGGLLSGNGTITDDAPNFGDGRLSINSGGTISPGESIGRITMEGRFDLNPGATMLIEVDLDHPDRNDVVAVDVFGNIRGIVEFRNIGSKPFAIGQSFHVVVNNFGLQNFPLNPNLDFTVAPAAPGSGLAWDTSEFVAKGIISIIEGPLLAPDINIGRSENGVTISWPDSHIGWVLQSQTANLTAGISTNNDDWTNIDESTTGNSFTIPIDGEKPVEFFRLTSPQDPSE